MNNFIYKNFLGLISACLAIVLLATLVKWLPDLNQKETITIAANSKNSDAYMAIQAIAKVVNHSSDHVQISVLETRGSAENIRLLNEGLVDMCTMQGDYNASENTQLVSILFTDAFQFIKHKGIEIKDIHQLTDKRIGISSENDAEFNSFKKIISHFNLTTSDFELITGNWKSIAWSFKNHEVDVIFKVRFPTSDPLKDLIKETEAEIIPIHQAAAICLQYPIYRKTEIPKGSYSGSPILPEEDIPSIGIDRLLVTRSDVSSELVAEICGTIFERRRDLSQYFEPLGFSMPPSEYSFIPLHEGTKNYLNKEKPNFWQMNSEPIALGLSVIAIIFSTILQLIANKKKQRVLQHNKNLIQLKFKIERALSVEQLDIYKDELSGFVARVVEDAVSNKISSSGFEFFSFTWESVQTALAEKERKLEQHLK